VSRTVREIETRITATATTILTSSIAVHCSKSQTLVLKCCWD